MARLHVAHGVSARLARGHADRGELAQHRGNRLELHEVHLDVLPGGDVPPPARVRVGEVAHQVELLRQQPAVRDLDPHHLVVAALALTVDAVVQPEDAEHVVIEVAREVAGQLGFELGDVGQLSRIDLTLQHGMLS